MKKVSLGVSALLALVISAGSSEAIAQDEPDAVRLVARWIDHKAQDAVKPTTMVFALHDGGFDLFDFGKPAPAFLEEWMRAGLIIPQEVDASLLAAYPQAAFARFANGNFAGGLIPPRIVDVTVDPAHHRYLTLFGRLTPSNDAFIGNEDPFRHEVFDEEGRFTGPLYIDVFGSDVHDAGVCINDETGLVGLDTGISADHLCQNENGVVHPHPGFNGSHRNPDGVPQRILGGMSHHPPGHPLGIRYDEVRADFSRPGYRLGRLFIDRYAASGPVSGSWYSPERSGEGFIVELLEPDPPSTRTRVMVSWFTYDPDDSGRQMWLTGIGELDSDGGVAADIEMVIATGGRFASTQNPDLVERERWGRIRIGWGHCRVGRVFYFPDDPAVPAGDYLIYRLSPEIEGLGWYCDDWLGPI